MDVLWAQQYAAILRNDRNGGDWIPAEADRLKRGVRGAEETQLPQQFASIPSASKLFRYIMVAAFSIFIEHELAHLRVSTVQRAWLRLKSMAQSGVGGAAKGEEDLVDLVALQQVAKALKALVAISPGVLDQGAELAALKANLLFFWADGMFDFFDGLRGLYAEDYLFEINFTKCELDVNLLQLIPDQVFAMTSNLRGGRYRPTPILTESEYKTLCSRLRSVTSHSHSAIRAERLLWRIIDEFRSIHSSVDPQRIGLVPGMIENTVHPERPAEYRLGLGDTVLTLQKVQMAVSGSGARMDSGYLCPATACYVAKQEATTLEVISGGGAIKELRMTFNVGEQPNRLFASVRDVLIEQAHIPATDWSAALEELKVGCPGAYKILDGEQDNDMVFLSKLATDGYASIRYINPDPKL